MRKTKEKTVDGDFLLSGCEFDGLSIIRWCVYEIGGVTWCELYHGGFKNNGLLVFLDEIWRRFNLAWEVVGGIHEWEHRRMYLMNYFSKVKC